MAADVLTDEQVEAWHTDRYTLVENFFDPDVVAAAVEESRAHVPTREDYDRMLESGSTPTSSQCRECGQDVQMREGLAWNNTLPFEGDTLNTLPFAPQMLEAAEQLLGSRELRLTQSILRASYGSPASKDQPMHLDYANNTLLTPSREDSGFGQVASITYLTDVEFEDAPTYVVGARDVGDRPVFPYARRKEDDPALYEKEFPVLVKAGTVLFYTMRTWHRGSKAINPKAFRIVHDASYRVAGADWIDYQPWSPALCRDLWGGDEAGRRCIERLTPREREILGVPGVGHPYWNDQTIAEFATRYPGIDVDVYRSAVAA